MRAAIIILLLLSLTQAKAQVDSSAFTYIQYSVKGYVLLANGEKILFQGITVDKYSQVVLFLPGMNLINGSCTYKGDVRAMEKKVISPSEIFKMKIRRQSFASGAAVGGVAGFGLGYLAGYSTYNYNFRETSDENDDNQKVRAALFGIGAAVPTALVGGFIGGLFIKKKFRINGNLEKMQAILHKVAH